MEGRDSLSENRGAMMAAYARQAQVNAQYQAWKQSGMSSTVPPAIVMPGMSAGDQMANGVTFLDRNGDTQMDEAQFYDPTTQSEMVNYGSGATFGQGWQPYNSNNILPPPPPPADAPYW
jgi:hypothetical protein